MHNSIFVKWQILFHVICIKSKREDKVVIIEIKTCSATESKNAKAREALAQIEDKNYAKPYH